MIENKRRRHGMKSHHNQMKIRSVVGEWKRRGALSLSTRPTMAAMLYYAGMRSFCHTWIRRRRESKRSTETRSNRTESEVASTKSASYSIRHAPPAIFMTAPKRINVGLSSSLYAQVCLCVLCLFFQSRCTVSTQWSNCIVARHSPRLVCVAIEMALIY